MRLLIAAGVAALAGCTRVPAPNYLPSNLDKVSTILADRAALASRPVAMTGIRFGTLVGTTDADVAAGKFTVKNDALRCTGTYNPWDGSLSLGFTISCSDGRTGQGKSIGDPSSPNQGLVSMSDGQVALFYIGTPATQFLQKVGAQPPVISATDQRKLDAAAAERAAVEVRARQARDAEKGRRVQQSLASARDCISEQVGKLALQSPEPANIVAITALANCHSALAAFLLADTGNADAGRIELTKSFLLPNVIAQVVNVRTRPRRQPSQPSTPTRPPVSESIGI